MTKEYFRILAPFTRVEDIKLLKDAGADELYCGYVTEELTEKWPIAFNTINRRGEGQSFEDYAAFRKAAGLAHKYNLPVYVTLNGLYTPEQYPLLLELVGKVERLNGIKGIIIADLGFLLTLRERGFKKEIHVGTGGTCFNSNTADFFSDCGAQRIILDRQLASHEIESIFKEKRSNIDVELFVVAQGCGGFIDGHCTFSHFFEKQKNHGTKHGVSSYSAYALNQDKTGCDFYFWNKLAKGDYDVFDASSCKEKRMGLKFNPQKHALFGCRVCDLYDLKKYPVKSLKIVGRGGDARYTATLVKFVSRVLSWLPRDTLSKINYRRKCKELLSETVADKKIRCTKFDCYFSPHWLKNEK
jgi:collagenase-like PrtC family protease